MERKAEALQGLVSGPLASSIAKLCGCSRGIPGEEDFHFYYNFGEFKDPIKEIAQKSETMLKSIGSCWSATMFPDDPDDAYDWLVDINDKLLERFDISLDQFWRKQNEDEGEEPNGFPLVHAKKKKYMQKQEKSHSVQMGSRERKSQQRVSFHIPSITRPQDQFQIVVDNSNHPFQHVFLDKTDDGSSFIHPLEKFSELDFVDRNIGNIEPIKPLPIECTPFIIVENVDGLKELAAKLRDVNEFAVDLEHNQYRSFQGLTCLMQISTRMEDFVVDTLKLRAQIGPYLREVFMDPSKKKVMHGADRDILWLQRDFSIYVCNLFDTGQASRILQLERNSLEYLLHHYCAVAANKIYQNADWRLRPIPSEMLKYAREDTHYLLHIYDLMRVALFTASASTETGHPLLLEVYKRSYDICMQLYEKEILTDTSYLHIYGLQGGDFNSQQVAAVSALYKWRDAVARAEDESTGYILPNKALLDIARVMPLTAGKLHQLVNSKHPYVECNLGSVVSIIQRAIQNASAFESAVEVLKKGHAEMAAARKMLVADESGVLSAPEHPTGLGSVHAQPQSLIGEGGNIVCDQTAECVATSVHVKEEQFEMRSDEYGQANSFDGYPRELSRENFSDPGQEGSTKVTEATVQVLKKPSRAFGALLGNSTLKKKLVLDPKVEIKVEQIKSAVTLQFHSFPDKIQESEPVVEERTEPLGNSNTKGTVSPAADRTKLEEIISLRSDSDQESVDNVPTATSDSLEHQENSSITVLASDTGDKPMSLSELSSSFQKCLHSSNGKRDTRKMEKSRETLQLKPFDYAAARERIAFGEDQQEVGGTKGEELKSLRDMERRHKNSITNRASRDEGAKDVQPVRRRQAFPHTGNRGATFH